MPATLLYRHRRSPWTGQRQERKTKTINQYQELRERQQARYNEFSKKNMFYAYSKDQFAEGMAALGLDPEADTDKIYHVYSGAYVLRASADELHRLLDSADKEIMDACQADTTGDGFIFDMFYQIMADHEYGYTQDAREVIDNCPYTLKEIQASPALTHGITKAAETSIKHYRECN